MDIMEIYFLIVSGLFGLAVGSFLNVCIYRIPKKIFFSEKHSYCPKCLQQLKWYDMFPVISWVILGGKCRFCKQKISVRYPIVESINCIMWVLSAYYFGISINAFIFDLLFSALLVMTFIDLDTKEIPNGIVLLIMALGVVLFFTQPEIIWWHRLVGAVVVSVPLYIVALVTSGGIGGGDIKLFFALGIVLGFKLTLVAFGFAIILGGLVGAILLISKVAKKGFELPLGPFIALGAVTSVFFGNNLIGLYMRLFGL
ncbi:MAG: prepilin peptidase [Clostridia bacterium]